jgi:phosphoribosylaminoimidazolecarboxamide formyltransferase/IMP cyclohydrolase
MFKNALVSCSDKTGLIDFLRPLAESGTRILSTGGTARTLREAGIKVVDVAEQTGFPEVMDGRVKTLHPKIHMALLARDDSQSDLQILNENKIEPFDLVIGNLYPFEQNPSVDEIDVGGPSFLRAAAKSFSRITVVCDPKDYEWLSNSKEVSLGERQRLAAKVFAHTSAYDSMIASYFFGDNKLNNEEYSLAGKLVQTLRYGENPQQKASWFRTMGEKNGVHAAQVLQGKELSYNNILDIDAAVSTLRSIGTEPTCVVVKHNNPCGVATHTSGFQALKLALESDPQSAFGGIVATNFKIDKEMATQLNQLFLECVVAPQVEFEAQIEFSLKKNLRVLNWPNLMLNESVSQCRTVSGGFLVQESDTVIQKWDNSWVTIGNDFSSKVKEDLLMAYKVCAHLKSNAISLVENKVTLGLGMGQVNRVDAVEQAVARMNRFHPQKVNPVLASDAFFPFADSIDVIAKAGIRFVIQPGGSIRDEQVMEKARELKVNLVLTGRRHFLH